MFGYCCVPASMQVFIASCVDIDAILSASKCQLEASCLHMHEYLRCNNVCVATVAKHTATSPVLKMLFHGTHLGHQLYQHLCRRFEQSVPHAC